MLENTGINALSYAVIGCAMHVHRVMGNGFQEVVYQRCLEIEMRYANLPFEREKEMPLFYRNENVGSRRADFVVANRLIVELKAVELLLPVHSAQAINYCEAYSIPDGLLINFGGLSLENKRVYNKKYVKPRQPIYNK